jgi:hypothetical protein
VNVTVAVPSRRVPAWHAWCIEALRREPGLTVRVVAVGGPEAPLARGPFAPLTAKVLAPVDVALDAGVVADPDVVVDLSGGAPSASPPFGVWSFRLGESDDAEIPFAGEIAAGRQTVQTMLVRRLGGRIESLRTGRFPVLRWYPTTVRLALAETARWPATLAAALAAGAELRGEPLAVASAPRRDGALGRARFGASLARRLAGALRTALFEVDQWNVGFAEGGPERLLGDEPLEVRWLPAPEPLRYIADPFVAERDGVRALFVETFDYFEQRGAIDALVLDDADRVVRRERAIDAPTHFSYPYPLEIDGRLYLIPESCEANEVALYRCEEFPHRWVREAALFPAFDAVDTTLFAHDGRWWAFCTRYSRGSTLALNAFYAGSPRGPWTPHLLNPIVVDVSSARPAGQPFVVGGALYRPAQDCSESYGGGLAIARIDELTPTAYRETVVKRHDARAFGRWNGGIHTVSFTRGRIVVDGKHVYRDLRKVPAAVRKGVRVARRLLLRPPAKEATFA